MFSSTMSWFDRAALVLVVVMAGLPALAMAAGNLMA